MTPPSNQQTIRSNKRSATWFLFGLAVLAIVATAILIYLLNTQRLGLGNLVVLAGLGGIVGCSLSPLLELQSSLPEQRSEQEVEGLTEAVEEPSPLTWPSSFVRLAIHAAGGFGCAAAGFVVTSALLSDSPGEATSALGTAAFGGGVGFLAGREINRMSTRWWSEKTALSPAIVTALGEVEDQLLGPPLLDYDGYAVARWHPSDTSSEAIGKIRVTLEARKVREERDDLVKTTRSDSETEAATALPTEQEAQVLLQGGRKAPLVPFAVSVISGTWDVQPYRRILAAPVEGTSETLEFMLLDLSQAEVKGSGTEEASHLRPELPKDAAVLIDVSQSGQTIQLFEMRISSA
jgi:hypothetical protein